MLLFILFSNTPKVPVMSHGIMFVGSLAQDFVDASCVLQLIYAVGGMVQVLLFLQCWMCFKRVMGGNMPILKSSGVQGCPN